MITSNEMRFFYEEQQQRLQALSKESPSFETIFSQIIDMVLPEVETSFFLINEKRLFSNCCFIEVFCIAE